MARLTLAGLLEAAGLRRPDRAALATDGDERPFGKDALILPGGVAFAGLAGTQWAVSRMEAMRHPVIQTERSRVMPYSFFAGWGALYEAEAKCSHYQVCMNLRSTPVVNRPRVYRPPNESALAKRQAQVIEQMLEGLQYQDVATTDVMGDDPDEVPYGTILKQMNSERLGYGFGVFEKVWELGPDGLARVKALIPRWQHQFTFKGTQLRVLTDAAPIEGEPLHPWQYVIVRNGMPKGLPWGHSLLATLYYDILALTLNDRDFQLFNNRFGIPPMLARRDRVGMGTEGHFSTAEKARMFAAYNAMRGGDLMVIEGVELTPLPMPEGTGENFERFAKTHEDKIERLVLGASGIVASDGTRASLDVSSQGQSQFVADDGDYLMRVVKNQIIRHVIDANWPAGQRYYTTPVIRGLDARGLETEMKVARVITEIGGATKRTEMEDRLGNTILKPDDPEAITPPAAPGDAGNAGPLPTVEPAGSRRADTNGQREFAPNRS